jgi:predicted N-acyltransferase
MADREDIIARLAPGVASIDAAHWDALAGPDDPFLSHAFLAALEDSASVGADAGWSALPILIDDDAGNLAGAAPAYLKTHSQGEYVFDHGWADGYERAGGQYYPKLQIAVPFTPVPGRRLLGARPQHLLAAAEAVVVQNGLSSAHATFIADEELAEFKQHGWLIRSGIQYHWRNRDYASFDDFLAALTSRRRKVVRKERQAAREGLKFLALRGSEIRQAHWDAMWEFYQDTGARKWGHPYLTRQFFDLLGEMMGDRVLLLLGLRDGTPIAGALNLIGADTLYGRYWGTSEEQPFLHFELCYYQAVDWAIAHGLTWVQAGAQGEHKLARGYEPVLTHSAHFIADAGFRQAVAQFVDGERAMIAQEMALLREELPYRSDTAS